MTVHEPKDKNNGVWLIFFMLGLGTLLPWNFFMTATMYFSSRLRDHSQMGTNLSGNGTGAEGNNRSLLEAKFNNVMTLCAMVPLLAFTCLNSVLHQRIPQKFRIMGSLAVILVVFLLTAILVKIEMAPLPFFTLTMIKIVIINSFGAILQGSLFGMAGQLPTKYTTPIMSGQGLAGTFAAFSMICAISSGSEINDAAFGYFITACVVILLAIISYVVLPKLEFYQYYKTQSGNRISDEENKLDLLKKENAAETKPVFKKGEEEQNVSMLTIFKKIWVLALSVCFAFTITIGTFPAVTVDVKSTIADGGTWELYFIPVCCFLLFNLSDWVGRSLTAVCMWPGKDSKLVPILLVARVIFVPLFMLCNVQPRYNLPIFFEHDAWFIVFMIVFAFSNGYLASLCMCFGPKKVAAHEAETAGAIMAFFMSLGLALGASLSFLFRGLV
ncbi:equilibrative nucleoside transporter 1-like isoform X4 [Oncorhynchus keta]|uniref:equilibrative nucleoside transporter 1-like isoform X1 n=1 Tax=Oncorhynchus keta TaxID=8018 RepID=UPI00227CFBD8|nr:equilibrative nucleoside transporter 1-like isoform X1 [Oncorhynchus keta]XP_052383326.1 equilibrative nucleoside transporter 1-like isoform X2 [Oncorhynchus keta]XP_052383327.1 equilibrative nucleoside transporter 1-like isoform X1 [Oncorhynchus keta]XP_052383328.1 equilibrative nucleoside transporter 1-like isoform X1 [Oncorhynchus keta]XP_052383329.1 equilibrative nucleoside transporter 1-like isoform X1 [Oncorhynchus keta]XP_052383330.1 equilibrative nucleoside transporter 1-like isofor